MKPFVIERNIPGIGAMSDRELGSASQTSNRALAELAPRVQWQHSYVAADRTFCLYLAESEEDIRRHAEISGIPATRIFPVVTVIDPTTASKA